MKKICLTVFTGLTTIILFAQDKKDLTISIGAGIINSPYNTNAKAYKFYNFDFDYYVNELHKNLDQLNGQLVSVSNYYSFIYLKK